MSRLSAWRAAGSHRAPWVARSVASNAWGGGPDPAKTMLRAGGPGISPPPKAVFRRHIEDEVGAAGGLWPLQSSLPFLFFPFWPPLWGAVTPKGLRQCSQGCQLILPPTLLVLKGVICIWLKYPWTVGGFKSPGSNCEADISGTGSWGGSWESFEPRAKSGPSKASRYASSCLSRLLRTIPIPRHWAGFGRVPVFEPPSISHRMF